MANELKDGGAAFPEAYYSSPHADAPSYRSGMSLRDWFAGQALVGQMVAGERDNAAGYAELAYAVADAMLTVRAKPQPEE